MQSFTYTFQEGAVNAAWATGGQIEVTKTPEGVLLQTGTATGVFLTPQEPNFLAEGGTILASAQSPQAMSFGWILSTDPQKLTYSVAAQLSGTRGEEVSFDLTEHSEWLPVKKTFGIVLPPQSNVLLHSIELKKWNMFEKLWNEVLSFWTLDGYRPYSINFIWGPYLANNPIERAMIYSSLPPNGTSATWMAILAILIFMLGIVLLSFRKTHRKHFIARRILIVFAVAWILFDARMGSEFLSWVMRDQKTYIGAGESVREFRERGNFYDFAAFSAPLVQDRDTYLFFAEQQWPYLGNMRYLTYPSIPGIDTQNDDTWVIYHRPDFGISSDGRLALDHEAITEPGEILGEFGKGSFVFRGKRLPLTPQ